MLCNKPELIKGKTVIEVGSGTGLLGCIAGSLGPKWLCMTDLPGLTPRLVKAAKENGLKEPGVKVRGLRWGKENEAAELLKDLWPGGGYPDVILVRAHYLRNRP